MELNLFSGDHATPSTWGDYDNDGRPDLYVSSYVVHPLNEHDKMYHNAGDHFSEVIPWDMLRNGATHGIQWADFDGNGARSILPCAITIPPGTISYGEICFHRKGLHVLYRSWFLIGTDMRLSRVRR
jgi:hypothetical protein